jgi:hypothetical protein
MHFRKLTTIIAISALIGNSCGAVARAGSSVAVEERFLAQEGLSFAFASTVLESQIGVILSTTGKTQTCEVLVGGGSMKLINEKRQGAATKSVVDLYYDTKCAKTFIEATSALTKEGRTITVKGSASYIGLQGDKLGSLTLSETAVESASSIGVAGTGTFVPAKGGVPVGLGLVCKVPFGFAEKIVFTCEGALAQNFPAVNLALGSITAMTLTVEPTQGGDAQKLFFTGSGSLATGGLDKLSVILVSPTKVGIKGASGPESTSRLNGSAAQFVLFPPAPTLWTVIDKAYDAEFSIHVVNDTQRNSVGTITEISSGTPLATFAVDQSGTGTIDYSDGSEAAITSWTLAD